MTTIRHSKWSIEYDAITPEDIAGMQADVLADHVNFLRRRLAEAEFVRRDDDVQPPAEVLRDGVSDEYNASSRAPSLIELGRLLTG